MNGTFAMTEELTRKESPGYGDITGDEEVHNIVIRLLHPVEAMVNQIVLMLFAI